MQLRVRGFGATRTRFQRVVVFLSGLFFYWRSFVSNRRRVICGVTVEPTSGYLNNPKRLVLRTTGFQGLFNRIGQLNLW